MAMYRNLKDVARRCNNTQPWQTYVQNSSKKIRKPVHLRTYIHYQTSTSFSSNPWNIGGISYQKTNGSTYPVVHAYLWFYIKICLFLYRFDRFQ
jgi:hypothetical protein